MIKCSGIFFVLKGKGVNGMTNALNEVSIRT
jgi:hypothetical protein